jgi:hypothetical protein
LCVEDDDCISTDLTARNKATIAAETCIGYANEDALLSR